MNHQKKNNRVEGAVPCGNPKRYGSRDVVHMRSCGSHDRKHKPGHEGDDNVTETEKHLQTLLNRQMKTDVTLSEQFSQHRSFALATLHDPEVQKLIGERSLDKYKSVTDLDARIDYLRHCGLDDAEVTLKLKDELKDKVTLTASGYGEDPQSKLQKLHDIQRKIHEKEESLKAPDTVKGALELSRHSLELEKSQSQRLGRESSITGVVTTQKKCRVTHPDDPINHIQEFLCDIEGKKEREPRRERRRRRKLERKRLYYSAFSCDSNVDNGTPDVASGDNCSAKCDDGGLHKCMDSEGCEKSSGYCHIKHAPAVREEVDGIVPQVDKYKKSTPQSITNPTVCHDKRWLENNYEHSSTFGPGKDRSESGPSVDSTHIVKTVKTPVQLISEDEIARNRFSLEEIRTMDKFRNYTQGEPNNVVYVKNLPSKITEEDLIALFGCFQEEGKPRVIFKLLSGRMKGQAFITFPDVETARRALHTVNGYKLQGRPVILSFGKRNG